MKDIRRITLTAQDNDSLLVSVRATGLNDSQTDLCVGALRPKTEWDLTGVPFFPHEVSFLLTGNGGGTVTLAVDGVEIIAVNLPESLGDGFEFVELLWAVNHWRFIAKGRLL